VDVGAQPGGDADLTADKDTLTFTPADWDTPQVVTVDAIGDANGTGQVTLFVAGTLDQAVAVTVLPVNDKPVAYGQSATTDEDTSRLITLSGGDIETPAEELLYAVSRQAEHGTVSISDNRATYTPDSNYNDPDSFEFTVTDDGDPAGSHANPGDLTSDAAVVMITVNSVNDAPLASGQTLEMVDLNGPLDIHLTGSDTETPEDELVYEIVSPPTSGIASIIDNVVTYTPDPDWRGGQDALIYAVTDGGGLSDTAVVTIDVTVPGIWVTIAKGYRVSYTDGDGTVVKVVMNKDGQARVRFVGESLQQVATRKLWLLVGDDVRIVDIRLLNTTVRSSLTFKTKGGDRLASVGRIRGNTPLGKLSGKTIDLVGDGIQLTGGGYVGSIQLHDVKNGADIIMPGTGAAKGITIKAGVLYSDTDIVLGSYLKNLSAVQWVGSSLTAPWASSISIKGDRRNNVAGDFGADLTFTGADPKKGVALGKLSVAGTITDSVITAKSGSVGTIMAAQWDAGSLNATWAKNIMTKGNRRDSSITGDFGATLNLTGQDKRGMSLNKLQVAGKVVGSQITLAGAAGTIMAAQWDSGSLEALWAKTVMTKGKRADRKGAGGLVGDFGATLNLTGQDKRGVSLNKLQVAGTARNSTVRTAGSMGSILLGATDGSDFLAGIADTAGRHASGEADFVNPLAVIRSVKIKGWKVPKGEAASRFFVDSNFSAASLGTVNLLNVDYSNDDESFGLFALDQGIGKAIKSISARDTVTGERWKWPVVPVGGEIDFEIGVIY